MSTGTTGANKAEFTHLHLHTSYSLLDGAIRIPELMQRCKDTGMSSVAMTDHGNMFGTIHFYKEAVKHGIKPIIGLEFYVAPGKRTDTKQIEKLADGNNYHLVILAANETGYKNLIKLTSRSYTEGFYRKPRIDYELLAEHSEGLICLSACIGGEIQRKIIAGKEDEAEQLAGKLKEIFGPERFYLEIQQHGMAEEDLAAKVNIQISKKLGIPLVITNDSHFLTQSDRDVQDILLRINQKKTIEDDLPFGFNDQYYVKTPEEMALLCEEFPEAMINTMKIAEMVDLNFEFGNPLLPKYNVPPGETLDSHMRKMALEGLIRRYGGGTLPDKVNERFNFEINVIQNMDFSGYFLIVQDFINYAKHTGIPVGPGRGSAAGSIVAFGLGITDIDPLKYDLLFERFLNPDRKEMPDIDVDFCAERREEVINYVRDKYGNDHVGQIITYGKMAAKACLKDVARVLNIPFDEANHATSLFPDELNISLEGAVEKSKDLKEYLDSGETQKRLFSTALALEGNVRHTGVHAAGIVISPNPLEEIIPLATIAAKTAESKNQRVIVSQYDMTNLTDVGLVKMDFLGLRNLTIIDHCIKSIERRLNQTIEIQNIPMDDDKTYKMLQQGDVSGVFQVESAGMREFVLKTKPVRFEDIIALIALFRPGPLQSGMSDSFINRKNGKEKVEYPHKDLEEILSDTYGVIVYQEQVMLISRIIGNFTPGESDALRKAMGKKKRDLVDQMRVKFLEGAEKGGYNAKWADTLYEQMAKFAEYGFNKSHSAAYALIVYQTAYLKANFPSDYMCAVLNSEKDKIEGLVPYINACREMGLKILGPNINKSILEFSVEKDGEIRFGLSAIKNVGEQAAISVMNGRENCSDGSFNTFFQFIENIDLKFCNRRTLESLIQAGCFQNLNYTRKALMESLEMAVQHGQKTQEDRISGQTSLFGTSENSSFQTEGIPRGEDVKEWNDSELLSREKEVLGFYFSGHPLQKYEKILKTIHALPISKLIEKRGGEKIEISGVITEYSLRFTKTGREMCRLTVEDMSGSLNAIIFPNALEKIKEHLLTDTPFFIRGILEKREETGTPQLIVNEISPLTRDTLEEKLEKSLHVKINTNSLNDVILNQLQTIMKCHTGNLAVYFHLVNGSSNRRVIKVHDSFNVDYSKDLIERLKKVNQVSGLYLTVGDQVRSIH
ncbi:MAG: DNA polymerase III subunit alpha [Spirochaetia bacterium]|nr:DNA polymerase III subunit alpha [Spirochaetia bacterium]